VVSGGPEQRQLEPDPNSSAAFARITAIGLRLGFLPFTGYAKAGSLRAQHFR
jgi:hypothetical protein